MELTKFDSDPDGVHAVQVSPCLAEPCIFTRGINAEVTVKFTAKSNSETPKMNVQCNQGGMWIDVPGLEEVDTSETDTLTLTPAGSVAAGNEYTAKCVVNFPIDIPVLAATMLKFQLFDDNNGPLLMIAIPAVLV